MGRIYSKLEMRRVRRKQERTERSAIMEAFVFAVVVVEVNFVLSLEEGALLEDAPVCLVVFSAFVVMVVFRVVDVSSWVSAVTEIVVSFAVVVLIPEDVLVLFVSVFGVSLVSVILVVDGRSVIPVSTVGVSVELVVEAPQSPSRPSPNQ